MDLTLVRKGVTLWVQRGREQIQDNLMIKIQQVSKVSSRLVYLFPIYLYFGDYFVTAVNGDSKQKNLVN